MPKTIAHIIHGQFYGGAEKIVSLINKRLNRSKFYPITVCLANGRLRSLLQSKGIESYLVTMKNKFDFSVIYRLGKLLKDKKIDLIHTHSVRTNLIGRIIARQLKIPTITTVHSPFENDSNTLKQRKFNPLVEKLTLPFVDKYITTARYIEQKLLAQGICPSKVTTIYNGIEISKEKTFDRIALSKKYGLSIKDNNIGMIAAFRPRKGAEYLLRSMPKVTAQMPNVRFVFIGKAAWVGKRDYMDELKILAKKLNVFNSAKFVGFCEDVPDIYAMLDMVVFPSLFGETSPLVLLEAMSMEKAVIASNIEGVNEVIDKKSGILVPPRDSTSLAEAILCLLKDKNKMKQMEKLACIRVKNKFEAQRMVSEYECIYSKTITQRIQHSKNN